MRAGVRGIHHIGVVVDDLGEARSFLAEVLSLEPESEFDDPDRGLRGAFFRCGPVRIEVIQIADEALRRERLGEDAARIDHVAVEVDDIDAALAALAAAGVDFDGPAPESRPAGRIAFTKPRTSDGIRYQLVEPTREPG